MTLGSCATLAPDPVRTAQEFEPGQGPGDDVPTLVAGRAILDESVDENGRWRSSGRRQSQARELVDAHPDSAMARTALAVTLAAEALVETPPELTPWRQAETEFLIAERLAPEDPEIARWHSRFLTIDGHLDAAAARLERALTSAPDDVPLLLDAMRVHFDRGAELRTIDLGERLVAVAPTDPDVLWMLAESRLRYAATVTNSDIRQRENYERAIEAFQNYRSARPEDAEGALGEGAARYGLALLLDDENAAAEVIAFYESAAERFPAEAEFVYGSALGSELDGDVVAAEASYRRAISIDEQHTDSLLNLVSILAASGREDEARARISRLLEIDAARPTVDQLPSTDRAALLKFLEDGLEEPEMVDDPETANPESVNPESANPDAGGLESGDPEFGPPEPGASEPGETSSSSGQN
ncbi:MAG: tetratricopeptide repeat protein [Planctomycetota bacterium]